MAGYTIPQAVDMNYKLMGKSEPINEDKIEGPEIPIDEKVKIKRSKSNETINTEGNEGNKYTVNTAKTLGGEIDKPILNKIVDTGIDLVPAILAAAMSKSLKGSKHYKNAKIKEAADFYNIHFDSAPLDYMEGPLTNPHGPLSRPIYKLYGEDAIKKINKIKKQVPKELAKLTQKHGYTNESNIKEAEEIIRSVVSDTYKIGDSKFGDAVHKYITSVKKEIETINPSGRSVTEKALSQGKGSGFYLNAPNVGYGIAGAAGVSYLANGVMDKGGIDSSSLPGLTELLDTILGKGWNVNKKEIAKQVNNWFDYVISEVDNNEYASKIKEAYADIDFNSTNSIVAGLENIQKIYSNYEKYERSKPHFY